MTATWLGTAAATTRRFEASLRPRGKVACEALPVVEHTARQLLSKRGLKLVPVTTPKNRWRCVPCVGVVDQWRLSRVASQLERWRVMCRCDVPM